MFGNVKGGCAHAAEGTYRDQVGEGHPAEEGGGEWNRAEQQGPQQVGADEYGFTGESVDPHPRELTDDRARNEVYSGEGGRLSRVDAEANDGEEGEGGSSDE